jgi:subtilisin family serine protease
LDNKLKNKPFNPRGLFISSSIGLHAIATMKNIILTCLLFQGLCLQLFGQNDHAWRNKVAPEVLAALNRSAQSDVLVAFGAQSDLKNVNHIHGKSAKAQYVFSQLQQTAQRTQAHAMRILQENNTGGNTLFLVNALAIKNASETVIRQLAQLPEVQFVGYDPWIFFSGPESVSDESLEERNGIEWGVERVNAPAVWALGYTGQGITVGGADTGYEWAHPAIQPHYRGWNAANNSAEHPYNWHDAIHDYSPLNLDTLGNPVGLNPCGLSAQAPCDDNSHGTHTMGTMTGDDGLGNQIGVAPGAKWIGCRNMERGWGRPSTYLECFQWFLAPTDLDGQNPNPEKAPHVINNSWYCDYVEGCTDTTINELLHVAVNNLRASGVMVVVSNGNFGSACATTYGAPAYFEESFSVGSFRSNDTISGFSSRGPVTIDQSNRIKPNISAPGQNVRSSVLNGGYQNYSGTSMAGPHVVGVVALILSARPDLAGEVALLEDILEHQAIPAYDDVACGNLPAAAIPNNAYGFGRIDALASLQEALAFSPVVTPSTPIAAATITPNPVLGEAQFNLENLVGKSSLEVFHTDGRVVFSKKWSALGHEIVRAPLETCTNGVYFWQLTSESGVVSGKLVKQ